MPDVLVYHSPGVLISAENSQRNNYNITCSCAFALIKVTAGSQQNFLNENALRLNKTLVKLRRKKQDVTRLHVNHKKK
jgi:hypothetical protein